ncbi:MAG: PQQ-dependent sugar dehydrogenase, partial [Woeseia sp.]
MNRFLAAAALLLLSVSNVHAQTDRPFNVEVIADFNEPWALAFLPDGRLLVTEKTGNLFVASQDGEKSRPVSGVPDVDYYGQGGLGDVALHPDYANNGLVYLSYAEAGIGNTRGAAVARGVLNLNERGGVLSDVEV